jgi:hypothetical protein
MARDRKQAEPTVGDELERLERMFPNKSGMRLRAAGERANRSARAATLWTYLESDSRANGRHYAVHETVFAKRESKSAAWWSRYFATKVLKGTGKNEGTTSQRLGVLEGAIVPGTNIRSRMQWRVRAVLGYNLHDNVRAVYTALHKGRH